MKKKPEFTIEDLSVEKVDDSDLKSVHGAGPGCDMCSLSCSSCNGCDMCSVIAR